jgi:hypothetical protein
MPRPVKGGRPGINVNPNIINLVRPGEQLPPNMKVAQYFQQTGQLPPGMGPSSQTSPIEPRPPGIGPRPIQPGFSVDPLPPMQPSSQIDPNSPRSLPFASAVGPTMSQPPVMPNSSIGAAQAAPAQPIAAMKKGGVVRGGRAEIKGTRPAKLT